MRFPLAAASRLQLAACCSRRFLNSTGISNRYDHHFTGFNRKFSSGKGADLLEECDNGVPEMVEFPGAKGRFTSQMDFISPNASEPVPCFRLLDDHGRLICNNSQEPQLESSKAIKMYRTMVTLQTLDHLFYEAQRQGRISFYLTNIGEEALNVASAAALRTEDVVFPQYREHGVLMWRGFTLNEFANQCFGNEAGHGKGRQMPIHYGSKELNYFTVSSPIATQLPHAVGAAYSLKMDKLEACAVTYFGDGGSSEGDFHAACNFAAVLHAPVLFICRNNGFAISTPTSEQYKGDGIVSRGRGYGITSIRVDGNDALAVHETVKAARRIAIEESKPVLIEAMTYRVGHHSTSDDSTKYRSAEEISRWRTLRDPVRRFRNWLEENNLWSTADEESHRAVARKEVIDAMNQAETIKKPSLRQLFEDVYDKRPLNLVEQEQSLHHTIAKHPGSYPAEIPLV